uniref:protein-tyrosine-phosphatase n=1 Tax=Odontella aurita TaxID=265563 RepID=A0A7S4HQY9_9STRA|mmetsp:Transcript_13674/g.39962  ORF Transcript_13674/g.39962 Transcript_13674/m.39962 type:complete len:266 (+) Transcript_13674:309-1106(+)
MYRGDTHLWNPRFWYYSKTSIHSIAEFKFFNDMGCSVSILRQRNRKLKFQEDDWLYVAALRDRVVLDWRLAIKANTEEERNAEIRRLKILQSNLPVKIADGLFLSDANGATRLKRLQELGITRILNVAGKVGSRIPDDAYQDAGILLQIIEAEDEVGYPILDKHLEETMSFIKDAKNCGGACLVHCQAGINRSGVLVAAYKMISERMDVLDVVAHCRKQRGNIFLSTNQGFQEQLVALARREGLLGVIPLVQSRKSAKDALLRYT